MNVTRVPLAARSLRLVLVCWLVWMGCSEALSQQPPPRPNPTTPRAPDASQPAPAANDEPGLPPAVTAESIAAQREDLEAATDLPEDVKKRAADLLDQAEKQLQQVDEFTTQAAAYEADATDAAERAAQIRAELAQLADQEPAQPVGTSVPELENELTQKQLEISKLTADRDASDLQPADRAVRRKDIRELLFTAPRRLDDIEEQLAAPAPAEESELLTAARRAELQARLVATEAEVAKLDNELAKYDAEDAVDLVRLKRDLFNQQIALAQREAELINERLREARTAASEAEVRRAAEEAVAAQPLLRPFAEQNKRLAEEALGLTKPIEQTEQEQKEASSKLEELSETFDETKARVASVGLTNSIGSMLRTQAAELPDVRKYEARVRRRQQTIDEVQFSLFDYDDERKALGRASESILQQLKEQAPSDMTASEKAELTRVVNAMSDDERREFNAAARHLLTRRADLLDSLLRNYNSYFKSLVLLSTTEQQMIQLSREFDEYINERVLWIRSNQPLLNSLEMDSADTWFYEPSALFRLAAKFLGDIRHNPLPYVVVLFPVGIALFRWRTLRKELLALGAGAQRATALHFAPTLRAAWLTLLLAIPIPAILWFLSWRCGEMGEDDRVLTGLSSSLWTTALALLPLEITRQVCRVNGLGMAHFGWPEGVIRTLRINVKFLILFAVPLVFLIDTLRSSDPTEGQDALERLLFIVLMIVIAIFLRRILNPQSGVFREYLALHRGGWADRLKPIWYWLIVAAPVGLAALVAIGFYYTAVQLGWRLYLMFCWIGVLMLGRALLLRLLLISRRKLLLQQMRERRAASESSIPDAPPASIAELIDEDFGQDVRTHTEQTRRLVTTFVVGLSLIAAWLAFVDILPALRLLDKWPITTTSYEVTETVIPDGETTPVTRSRTVVDPVTIADIAFGLLVAVLTFVAARNIPGVLEISLLQRLPLDNSVRYAITSLVSYAIVLLGLIIGAQAIGLRWQQVQWLATALTFGLAFGLQEMFANFVSGIIILFERPVRVGDIVTVSNTTGIVSRVRMRATTITDWDRKDFVVPNKEFITGQVLNWTLSDRRHRIVINVGVAYGSDTARTKQLLMKIATEHPLTLDDPAPLVTFEGFGDNTLNFVLRTYIPGLEVNLQVTDELHTQIDQAFREAGIEIAFPQRDLHLRSVSEEILQRLDGRP